MSIRKLKMGTFYNTCKIYFFETLNLAFRIAFSHWSLNQMVYFLQGIWGCKKPLWEICAISVDPFIPSEKIFPRFPVSRSIARDVRRLSDLLYERFLSGFWLKQGKRSKDSVNWEQSGFLAHLEPQKIELIFLAEKFYFLRFARVITSFSSSQFLRKLAPTV